MVDKFELQRLRDLPIEGVAERLGLQVSRHKCLCPFHDDHHASLSFKVSKNTFRCFVCGESGGPIDLVMKYLNKDFLDACRWLADENCVILTEYKPKEKKHEVKPFDAQRYARYFEHPWLSPDACKFLFEKRQLHPAVVRYCRLNSFRDWLQIPYYNLQGELIGIQRRYMGNDPEQPRFRFPQGSECSVYNLPVLNLLKPGETLFITEGCSDCWAMLSSGHKAIAIPSATLLKRKDAELLETLNLKLGTKFAMYPDNDAPGERLFLQLQKVLPSLVHHQLPQGCKDFSEYFLKEITV
jgi:DNA primase